MPAISLTHNFKAVSRQITKAQREVNFAAATALNIVGKRARENAIKALRNHIKIRASHANATKVLFRASAQRLTTAISNPLPYLGRVEIGGRREAGTTDFPVPRDAMRKRQLRRHKNTDKIFRFPGTNKLALRQGGRTISLATYKKSVKVRRGRWLNRPVIQTYKRYYEAEFSRQYGIQLRRRVGFK